MRSFEHPYLVSFLADVITIKMLPCQVNSHASILLFSPGKLFQMLKDLCMDIDQIYILAGALCKLLNRKQVSVYFGYFLIFMLLCFINGF